MRPTSKLLKRCEVCNAIPTDRCHIRSRGAGGDWDEENIIMFCRTHHQQQHQYGWIKFLEKYPQAMFILEQKGWEITEQFGIKKLMRK